MKNKSRHLIAILTLAVLLVAIVLYIETRPRIAVTDREHQDAILYRLKWLANTGFAGDLVADTYGYFREEGLRVTVKAGGPEKDAIRELSTGQAKFGVASADQVIQALSQGADIVVVAQIYQKNPVAWIYRNGGKKLLSPVDLAGKRVGVTYGDNDEAIMKALLKKNNVTAEREDRAPKGFLGALLVGVRFDYQPFVNKRVDFFPVYINTQGVDIKAQLQQAGEHVDFFAPDKYGIKFVANSIVTTARTAKEDPDLVKRFVRAALKGWSDVSNPAKEKEVVRAITSWSDSVDRDAVLTREKVGLTRELIQPTGKQVIGSIDKDGWQQTEDIMVTEGLVKRPVHVVDALRPEFLEADTHK